MRFFSSRRFPIVLTIFLALLGWSQPVGAPKSEPPAPKEAMPDPGKWRGFNLTDMVVWSGYGHKQHFLEWDFQTISEFGFDYVRWLLMLSPKRGKSENFTFMAHPRSISIETAKKQVAGFRRVNGTGSISGSGKSCALLL